MPIIRPINSFNNNMNLLWSDITDNQTIIFLSSIAAEYILRQKCWNPYLIVYLL